MDARSLMHRYLLGVATEDEARELDRLLANDPQFRREFVVAAATDVALREVAFERAAEPAPSPASPRKRWSPWLFVPVALASVSVAALVVIAVGLQRAGPPAVAVLASSENAAWESALPTTPGSDLVPGTMRLVSGIATIRFQSGAELVMEAPANLELISAMRCRLVEGAAVVDVPEPAVGFVLETPGGYIVDHGTQFAVSVAGDGGASDFQVLKGEISVHLAATGEELRLTDRQSASIANRTLVRLDGHVPEGTPERSPRVLRIGTNGRATSVVRNDKRERRLHPDLLMVKRTDGGTQDRRSFFEFDLSEVDRDAITAARLRLNQVPSGVGFATRLPTLNRFAVYGLTNDDERDWVVESLWDDSPGPEDGVLLGRFDVPRSRQRGGVVVEGDELLRFLREQGDRPITLILVRETTQISGEGPGLVHAFANDTHPEAAGPVLELSLNDAGNRSR